MQSILALGRQYQHKNHHVFAILSTYLLCILPLSSITPIEGGQHAYDISQTPDYSYNYGVIPTDCQRNS
jgi:hypothetical protein